MATKVVNALAEIDATQWNALRGTDNPFLRHEFLCALETHACVGPRHGWIPRHLVASDERGRLLGAVPLYYKDNSYGEFVFDWSWADAYQRNGLHYYPKAVVGVPYTPVTGSRLLISPHADRRAVAGQLIEMALEVSRRDSLSSLHWLFTDAEDTQQLEGAGLMLRLGCQFHWHNLGYRDFHDYLETFSSRKRKKVKRERRQVREQNIELRVVHGHQASDAELHLMYGFYRDTFDKKWGYATLSEAFFRELATRMGPQLVFFVASRNRVDVAGAICLRNDDTLYGRHWGCTQDYHSLHFETCYYTGIQYCIERGLRSFEPGAQGEHKISRGFMPTATWSAHWIAHPGFRASIGRFVQHEAEAMRDYMAELSAQSPFREHAAA